MGKNNAKGSAGASDKKGGKGKDNAKNDTKKDDKGKAPKGAQSVNVRHILCEKYSKKEEALEKLRNGAKFDDIAREYSEDKARSGGSLGFMERTKLEPAFAEVAFALETSTTGNPKWGEAKTQHGYHILIVEGRK
ncbi:hypothetical protein BDV18DRAFT_127877 [Aspergillus unguis]